MARWKTKNLIEIYEMVLEGGQILLDKLFQKTEATTKKAHFQTVPWRASIPIHVHEASQDLVKSSGLEVPGKWQHFKVAPLLWLIYGYYVFFAISGLYIFIFNYFNIDHVYFIMIVL